MIQKELKKRKQKWIVILTKTNAISIQKATLTQKTNGKPNIPPLLITLRIARKNLHNYLVDGSVARNVITYETCNKIRLPIIENPKKGYPSF